MKKNVVYLAIALAITTAGSAFAWDDGRGFVGNIVSGTGDVAADVVSGTADVAAEVGDVPENVVTGKYDSNYRETRADRRARRRAERRTRRPLRRTSYTYEESSHAGH